MKPEQKAPKPTNQMVDLCLGIALKAHAGQADLDYNTAAKSNRFGTQDKPNKNVIRTWATTQEKSIQRISRPK